MIGRPVTDGSDFAALFDEVCPHVPEYFDHHAEGGMLLVVLRRGVDEYAVVKQPYQPAGEWMLRCQHTRTMWGAWLLMALRELAARAWDQ